MGTQNIQVEASWWNSICHICLTEWLPLTMPSVLQKVVTNFTTNILLERSWKDIEVGFSFLSLGKILEVCSFVVLQLVLWIQPIPFHSHFLCNYCFFLFWQHSNTNWFFICRICQEPELLWTCVSKWSIIIALISFLPQELFRMIGFVSWNFYLIEALNL